MALVENPPAAPSILPWLVGGAILGGILIAGAAGASGAAPALAPGSCPVDSSPTGKFNAWLVEKQLAGVASSLTVAPSYAALVAQQLAPANPGGVPYVLVLADGTFWYYPSPPSSPPQRSDNLRDQYCTFVKTLAGLRGHPVRAFLLPL